MAEKILVWFGETETDLRRSPAATASLECTVADVRLTGCAVEMDENVLVLFTFHASVLLEDDRNESKTCVSALLLLPP